MCGEIDNGLRAPQLRRPSGQTFKAAGRMLRAGGLVAFPTETVYGLGADATNDSAVAAIFAAKRRPEFNPLIVHFLDLQDAAKQVSADARAEALATEFWPGPLTLVLPRRADSTLSLLVSAGLDSVGVRAPRGAVVRRLLEAAGRPIAAPSANLSGEVSPTIAAHVAESFGGDVLGGDAGMIIDGGACPVGIESTVVDLCGGPPLLLRPGGLPVEMIESVIGPLQRPERDEAKGRSPGRLASHYAPRLPVRLEATDCRHKEALLAFGPKVPVGCSEILNLSPAADLTEAAANLFAMLRALDRPRFSAIAVMPIPDHGLGLAINDRLQRAAASRDA